MSYSIYDLDEDIRKLLNLDNYLNGMSVPEFVEELSKDHFNKGQEVNKLEYLDPKPYIRTFESTLRELKQLQSRADEHCENAERETENSELRHSENVVQLSGRIDAANADFDDVDAQISQVSSTLNPVGLRLASISSSRDVSQETIFLIRAFHGFYTKGGYEPLEALRGSKRVEDQLKCASTLKHLSGLGAKLDGDHAPKNTAQCVDRITEFCESSEKRWLSHFQTASEYDDLKKMKEVADILTEYNGGDSVVAKFIENTNMALVDPEDDVADIVDNEEIWVKLSDPNYLEAVADPGTKRLLDRLKFAIKAQSRIVVQVFAEPAPVLRTLLYNVYREMVRQRISEILSFSLTVSKLAHVRMLHCLYLLVNDFTVDIKEFLVSNDFDNDSELTSVAQSGFAEAFAEYIGDGTYMEREKASLTEIVYSHIQRFTTHHSATLQSRALRDKVKAKVEGTPEASQTESRRLQQFKQYVKKQAQKVGVGANTPEPDSPDTRLQLATVETILKSAIEAIARMMELTPTRAPEHALEVLEIVIFDFGGLYVGGALEVAYARMDEDREGWAWTPIFSQIATCLYFISSCIQQVCLPCAVNSPAIKARMSSLTNAFSRQCEVGLNVILQESIGHITARVAALLAKQKKRDYLTEAIDSEDDTEACEAVCAYLEEVHAGFVEGLNGANLKTALIRIGMNVLAQLLDHYKKFTVDYTGGIVLTKDVVHYQSVIDEWGIPELSEEFGLLKEIGNLFTVQYSLIDSLVTEGRLASLKAYAVRQYVSKRADFAHKRTMGQVMEQFLQI
ncbi:exocyst complex component Sec10p [Diutina catenulata]